MTGEPGRKRRFGASEIAALAATVAAMAAVAVAVWDNVQQREFYRLSVVPSLDYLPSKEGTTGGAIALTNAGVGPAEVRHARIALCEGSESASFPSWNTARDALAFRIRYASVYDEPFVLERRPECLPDG